MEDDSITSGFDGNDRMDTPFVVDFSVATKLDAGGSTCDVYVCTIQHRRVFVKRLKEEFRNKSFYRAAFNKEYDLGVTLSHRSLPRYVGFGDDYIVMDFIEGQTLDDLIKRDDSRLKDRRFVKKLLGELVDVVEYLHNRNIVHCDIKADNVIVSPYADGPVTLIDFDKAYSSWLDSTHGEAGKYGCAECADGQIDFKGIGLLAGKLGLKRLAKVCGESAVSVASARRALKGRRYWPAVAVLVVIAAVSVVGTLLLRNNDSDKAGGTVSGSPVMPDSAQAIVSPTEHGEAAPSESQIKKPTIDNAWIDALIAGQAAKIEGYKRNIWRVLDNDSIPVRARRLAISDCIDSMGSAYNRVIYESVDRYRNLNEVDVQLAVRNNSRWQKFEKCYQETVTALFNWNPKESQRSSGRPVSPPDTIRDVAPSALHR